MSRDTYQKAFDRVFTNEGGFQNDPEDRGNWTTGIIGKGTLKGTKFGLSAMTYPELDIESLDKDDARAIYYRDWWVALGMDWFRPAMSYQLFDAAVNHGMDRATKLLQKAAGTTPDGIIGHFTREAVATTHLSDLLLRFLAHRLQFFSQIPTFDKYGRGWSRRIAHNLLLAAEDN